MAVLPIKIIIAGIIKAEAIMNPKKFSMTQNTSIMAMPVRTRLSPGPIVKGAFFWVRSVRLWISRRTANRIMQTARTFGQVPAPMPPSTDGIFEALRNMATDMRIRTIEIPILYFFKCNSS